MVPNVPPQLHTELKSELLVKQTPGFTAENSREGITNGDCEITEAGISTTRHRSDPHQTDAQQACIHVSNDL
ncbi:hypothetical protein M758_10G059000 [Ceratodon purpureus]|nr:hypothetical protein M758_10G059000 [Ceratodon purpureus]